MKVHADFLNTARILRQSIASFRGETRTNQLSFRPHGKIFLYFLAWMQSSEIWVMQEMKVGWAKTNLMLFVTFAVI
jgi:hypothetical protein